MDANTPQISTPPWLQQDLPEGTWHTDTEFLERAREDLKGLAQLLESNPINNALADVIEEECDCRSLDGAESDLDEMEETFCPYRSSLECDYNRLEDVINTLTDRQVLLVHLVLTEWTIKQPMTGRENPESDGKAEYNVRSSDLDLPEEVLFYIVKIASPAGSHTLFALSRVNRMLRGAMLSMPLLWANLDAMDRVATTKIKLDRSRDVPLTVDLSVPPLLSEEETKKKLSSITALLEPERRRIQKLFIEPFHRDWMISATEFLDDAEFPSLETLLLGFQEDNVPRDLEGLTLQSSVRELHLRRTLLDGSIGTNLPPLTRLSLTEVSMPVGVMQKALIALPGLQSLITYDVSFPDVPFYRPKKFSLPHLRYLSARRSATQIIAPDLKTPSLSTLYLDNLLFNGSSAPQDAEVALLVAIARGNRQLRRLHAEDCFMKPEAWAEVFLSLPELEYLHLKGCRIEKRHLAALAGLQSEIGRSNDSRETKSFACPRLQEIIFDNELALTSTAIMELVEVRYMVSEGKDLERISWITLRGCDSDLIAEEDIYTMAGLTRSVMCDLVDGNDVWGEGSEDSYIESGDEWEMSDWEREE
ncbi:hypothetical protein FRC00_000596 [Tulasnella sp. 408]|nr:hypothetical protein FRC00_000596 [Tulasnella sp. 408]